MPWALCSEISLSLEDRRPNAWVVPIDGLSKVDRVAGAKRLDHVPVEVVGFNRVFHVGEGGLISNSLHRVPEQAGKARQKRVVELRRRRRYAVTSALKDKIAVIGI